MLVEGWKAILDIESLSCCVENLADAGEFLLIKGKVVKGQGKSDMEEVESADNQKSDIIIETNRLIFKEFKKDDWKEVHLYSTDEEVVRFMPWGPNTEEDTRAFIDRALKERDKNPRKEYHFAVIEKISGNLIGTVEIALGGHKDRHGMLGYCYSRKSWEQGIGIEAAGALIKYGFESLELHRIWADCDTLNYG